MFATHFISLLAPIIVAQAATGNWDFYAVEVRENVGCANSLVTQLHYTWRYAGPSADTRATSSNISQEFRQRFPGSAYVSRISVRSGSPAIIGIAKSLVRCRTSAGRWRTAEHYRFYTGATRESIARAVQAQAGYSDVVGLEIVEWIDTAAVIAEMTRDEHQRRARTRYTTIGVRG